VIAARPASITCHIDAPRSVVYRTLLDPRAIAMWRVPAGMTSRVHEFDPREDGAFRISLTYDEPTGTGKTSANTDTYHGHFATLVPNERVVEVVEFEAADPELRGEMTIITARADADGGTGVVVVFEGIPSGVSTTDNGTGTRMALANLAAIVEAGESRQPHHPRGL
jgi:uncharacterized protein YndB with AHSA1/START domain